MPALQQEGPAGASSSSSSSAATRFAFYAWDPTQKTKSKDELAQQDVKILFYSPSFASQDEKRSQVSMTEGLVGFTQQFDDAGAEPLHCIRTKKYSFGVREVFLCYLCF